MNFINIGKKAISKLFNMGLKPILKSLNFLRYPTRADALATVGVIFFVKFFINCENKFHLVSHSSPFHFLDFFSLGKVKSA
jgi:hypothetical protein